jgi:uncharacterized protein (TIGR04255 family)
MPVRYRKAPLVEAIFECFVHPRKWTPSAAERMTKLFSLGYSGKTELIRSTTGFQLSISPDGQSLQPLDAAPDRIRLWKADKSAMVQFAADMCAFNALPPYQGFPEHMPEFKKLFEAFLAESQAQAIKVLGQRYINRVRLPGPDADPANYFAVYPKRNWSGADGELHPPFAMQIQTSKLSSGQVVMNLAYEGLKDGEPVYLLDLYARGGSDEKVALEWPAVEAWQREAHQVIFSSLEAALTNVAKEYLGREETP